MKKMIALLFCVVLVLSLGACQSKKEESGNASQAESIFDHYPKTVAEWTAADFNNYFKEVGVYTKDDFIYVQDHAYYAGMVIEECGGYMDDAGLYFTGVFVVNEKSTEGDAAAFLAGIKESKTFPEEMGSLPVDHLVGNVVFFDSFCGDEEFYNAFEKAIVDWAAGMKVELDF